jgi:hypothetical protein
MPTWWNWKVSYAAILLALLLIAGIGYLSTPSNPPAGGVMASIIWGVVTLVLCVVFMLGAAKSPMQFLIFFGTGAFGAGAGYLVGAWLTPSDGNNPLDQIRNIVAGVLTGVVGTKLLSLWDDLVDPPKDGTDPRILTAPYYVPIIMWLVGFTVSLSAFYTVRTGQSGTVRVTYTPRSDVRPMKPTNSGMPSIGILPGTTVTFAGAANSPVDLTVSWDFQMKEVCTPLAEKAKDFNKTLFDKEMKGAFDATTAKLTTPPLADLQNFIAICPGSEDWVLTATSNQNRSSAFEYAVKFCRTKDDCPLASTDTSVSPAKKTPDTNPSSGTGGSTSPTQPSASQPPEVQPVKGGKVDATNADHKNH